MSIAELPETEVSKVPQRRITITAADVAAVLEKWPTLTSDGLGVVRDRRRDPLETAAIEYESRAELFNRLESIGRAADWLSVQPRRKSLNPHCNSYGLKHEAERDLGEYISNGEFICAAVHLGFLIKPDYPGCINVMMNIGKGRR